ncbi:MAG TPA: DUF4129 domain-containing protein [Rudaea sp.]
MHLDGLTITLRPRAPWEATDLGIALARAHAGRIYAAWFAVTLPAFVVINALAYLVDVQWLGAVAMWWLKPVFDRIPLFVLSRAVFGAAPTLRETLHAQRTWAWRGVLSWLTWRRLHPGRAMLLSVDLLEGVRGAQRRERVRVLTHSNASPNIMLTVIGAHIELMLGVSTIVLALMFVPVEFLPDSAKAVWETLFENPPRWAQALGNLNAWMATTIVEPFYVGAGFGLYLNRRIQLEGWDIELSFRRLAAQLAQPIAAAALALIVLIGADAPARAQERGANGSPTQEAAQDSAAPAAETTPHPRHGKAHKTDTAKKDVPTLHEIFADHYRDDGAPFAEAVRRAYTEQDLHPTQRQSIWKPRQSGTSEPKNAPPPWIESISGVFGFIAQYGLWILVAVALFFIAINHRRWLPWLRDRIGAPALPKEATVAPIAALEPLPDDVPAAVRALWQRGQLRAALALLYRAAVERLASSIDAPLPPGATESQCLRLARASRDAVYAALFARIVRCWQAAAYAQRMPRADDLEALLAEWNARPEPVP